ncbi:uncharacterized protein CC84DRAFT_1214604 [Paraphaeosphaeria sporulosa]|uniref:Uncharacterized protein n=1 Tax=Paraphaeosphaeria sporulosa TaxID=1460663 RepID=A0A177CM89_9PLEO|nr:uncharacterized protein CC84DRAFT_1214604 [Paraphaeosphaeria sporulosa]OAG08062.1 hypothetical protein CC84DRAFT_1214604 [Paraphaeosphaeria sporulosa]
MDTLLARVPEPSSQSEVGKDKMSSSQEPPAASFIPQAIIDATEKGMMGTNGSSGSWSTENVADEGAKGKEGKSADGIGEDGCRHVRWKGTDV